MPTLYEFVCFLVNAIQYLEKNQKPFGTTGKIHVFSSQVKRGAVGVCENGGVFDGDGYGFV